MINIGKLDVDESLCWLTDQALLGTICAAICRFSAHCCALSLIIEVILFLQLLYIEFMTIMEKLDFF